MATQPSPPAQEEEEEELYYQELNPTSPTTILLIHGLFSSSTEFSYITPFLSKYHLLIPDLPGHSHSSHLSPSTFTSSSSHLATLIRKHAHNSRAHVVGISIGGFVAIHLAVNHPSLAQSLFVSGCPPFEGGALWMASHPSVFWYAAYSVNIMPDFLYHYSIRKLGLLPHDELRKEVLKNKKWEVVRDVLGSVVAVGWEDVRALKGVRTLALAAEKQDPIEGVRKMGVIWREEGEVGNRAVLVEGAAHAWDLQLPELFARGIVAWVEEKPLPEEFKELKGVEPTEH